MRRRILVSAMLVAVGTLACVGTDQPTQQSHSMPFNGVIANAESQDSLEKLLIALYPPDTDPLARLGDVFFLVNGPSPDTALARTFAFGIIDKTLDLYKTGQLNGGQSPAVQDGVTTIINSLLETVGLPPNFNIGALDPDGASAVIDPNSPNTTVVTETLHGGVQVNTGQVSQTTLVSITRLPNSPPPLLTPFDQFPFFYQFNASPDLPFTSDVVVGVCHPSDIVIPDESRLRIAHNIPPFTFGSVEVLPLVAAPFLDCSNALSSSNYGSPLLRSLASIFTPQPLYAATAVAAGGIGGTTRKFSPFGAVDTLARQDGTKTILSVKKGAAVTPKPGVSFTTPTGRRMPGITVNFVIISGGGTVTGATQVTDANGVAYVGSWKPAIKGKAVLKAIPVIPQGTGFINSPTTFTATVK